MTNIHKNSLHALSQRLLDFQIKPSFAQFTQTSNTGNDYTFKHFDEYGEDIRLYYCDLNGVPKTFKRDRAKSLYASDSFTERFYRTRYTTPRNNANGKPIKYSPPKGTKIKIYQNGLFQFFKLNNPEGLNEIETLYVTEGEFKAFVSCMFGIPAIGIPGIHSMGSAHRNAYTEKTERVTLHAEFIETLQELKNLKSVVLIHDADALDGSKERRSSFYAAVRNFSYGMNEANRQREQNNQTPLAYSYWFGNDEEQGKGIDDVLINNPFTVDDFTRGTSELFTKTILSSPGETNGETLQRLKDLKNVFKLQNEAFVIPYTGTVLKVKDRVSECTKELISLIETPIEGQETKIVFVSAPTGAGKTYAFINEVSRLRKEKNPFERAAMVVPTIALAEQIGETYGVPVVRGGSDNADVMAAASASFFVATYDSAPKVGEVDFLIVDEAHHLTRNFREKATQGVLDLMHLAKKVVLMSGTPVSAWKEFGAGLIEIQVENVAPVDVLVHELGKGASIQDQAFKVAENASKLQGLTVIRLNRKTEMKAIKKHLVDSGVFQPFEISTLTSDDKDSAVFESIVKQSIIPESVRVLITTSLLDDGVNINNENIDGVHFFQDKIGGRVSTEECVQFIARFRNWRKSFHVYFNQDERTSDNPINPIEYLHGRQKAANLQLSEISSMTLVKENQKEVFKYYLDKPLVYYSQTFQEWAPNPCGIIADSLRFFAERIPLDDFINQLNSFQGVNVIRDHVESVERVNEYHQTKTLLTCERRNELTKFKALLNDDPLKVFYCLYHVSKFALKKKIIERFGPAVKVHQNEMQIEINAISKAIDVEKIGGEILGLETYGLTLAESVEVWETYSNTSLWRVVSMGLSFWEVLKRFKSGKAISKKDLNLAKRIDIVRVLLLDLKDTKLTLNEMKAVLYRQGSRIAVADLKVWVSLLAKCELSQSKRGELVKVIEVYDSETVFKSLILEGKKEFGFFKERKKVEHPEKNAVSQEGRELTRNEKKAIPMVNPRRSSGQNAKNTLENYRIKYEIPESSRIIENYHKHIEKRVKINDDLKA